MRDPWYYQNKIKLIDERLEFEREYRYDMDKLIESSIRKYKIYFWTALVLLVVDILFWLMLRPIILGENISNVGDLVTQQIMILPLSLIAMITVPGAVVCVYKALYYRKRMIGNKDPRDGQWRTYKFMMDKSADISDRLEQERMEAVTSLEISRFEDDESLEVDDMSDGPEPEKVRDDVIPFSELLKAKNGQN